MQGLRAELLRELLVLSERTDDAAMLSEVVHEVRATTFEAATRVESIGRP